MTRSHTYTVKSSNISRFVFLFFWAVGHNSDFTVSQMQEFIPSNIPAVQFLFSFETNCYYKYIEYSHLKIYLSVLSIQERLADTCLHSIILWQVLRCHASGINPRLTLTSEAWAGLQFSITEGRVAHNSCLSCSVTAATLHMLGLSCMRQILRQNHINITTLMSVLNKNT